MSYQPPGAVPPAMPAPATPPPAAGGRRTALAVAGALALLAGVVVGGILIASGGSSEQDAVKDLARAPVNCTTTLRVDDPDTFVVFIETEGRLGDLDGACDADREYSHAGSRIPTVEVTITDDDGDELDLDRRQGVSYDVGGYRGESIRDVVIDTPGDYEITVLSSADDVAVAIGTDPSDAAASTRMIGIAVLVVGVLVGALLIILGSKRRGAATAGGIGVPPPPSPPWVSAPPPVRGGTVPPPPPGPFTAPPPPPPPADPWRAPPAG